jgi:uncharacterized protein YceK
MRKQAIAAFLALGAICTVGGCGTMTNVGYCMERAGRGWTGLESTPIYGGVQVDVDILSEQIANIPSGYQEWKTASWGMRAGLVAIGPIWAAGIAYFALIDLPYSALGDTVTLPITIAADLHRKYSASSHREGKQRITITPSGSPVELPDEKTSSARTESPAQPPSLGPPTAAPAPPTE